MIIYQVFMEYYDGDHDHGSWESPLFSNRQAAEEFLDKVQGEWWHANNFEWRRRNHKPRIIQYELLDECPTDIDPEHYLVLYT